ncbi:MAG TPA: hypothetical protein VGH16_14880 [Candidatus Binatia bacterium]|jgi:hypothetical protein
MKRIETLFLALVACSLLFLAGCYVAAQSGPAPYAGGATYYYYPDAEVYFYPNVGLYYWYDGGSWHHDRRVPDRFRLNDRDRVRLNWSREPHLDHDRVRSQYPPHRDYRDNDRDRDRNRDRERSPY